MPFLAPAIPAIASLAGGLIGKATGFGGPNPQQQAANTNLANFSTGVGNQGLNFLSQAQTNLGAPASYFQSILNGNMGEPTAALAPQLNQIRNQAQNTLQSTTNLAPRGGGRSSILFSEPQQEQAAEQSVFNAARPQAAQGLAAIGAQQGGLGNQGVGVGTAGANDLLQQLAQQKKAQFDAGSSLGSSLFNITKNLNLGDIWGKLFNGGTIGGNVSTPGTSGPFAFPGG